MSTGSFVELERPWHDTHVIYCQVCGRLIPRRAWVFDGGAGPLQACSPGCEDLYERYWKPTHGVMESRAHHTR